MASSNNPATSLRSDITSESRVSILAGTATLDVLEMASASLIYCWTGIVRFCPREFRGFFFFFLLFLDCTLNVSYLLVTVGYSSWKVSLAFDFEFPVDVAVFPVGKLEAPRIDWPHFFPASTSQEVKVLVPALYLRLLVSFLSGLFVATRGEIGCQSKVLTVGTS